MIGAFFLRKEVDKVIPAVWKHHLNAARMIRPLELDIANSKYAAQD
jgi:hypothetical protein